MPNELRKQLVISPEIILLFGASGLKMRVDMHSKVLVTEVVIHGGWMSLRVPVRGYFTPFMKIKLLIGMETKMEL